MALLTDSADITEEIARIRSVASEVQRYLLDFQRLIDVPMFDIYEHLEEIAMGRCTADRTVNGETLAERYQLEPLNLPNSQTFEHINHSVLHLELTRMMALFDKAARQKLWCMESNEMRNSIIKNFQEAFHGKIPHDPDDPDIRLHAIGKPARGSAIRILTAHHRLWEGGEKLLLRGNMFLGHVVYWCGGVTPDQFETFPLRLANDTELVNAAFELWDPVYHKEQYPNLYGTFQGALGAARLLLQ